MPLKFGTTDVKAVTFNGTTVNKIIFNGVEVWTSKIYLVQNEVVVGGYASGQTWINGRCSGDESGYHNKQSITISSQFAGRKLRITFRADVNSRCFNGQRESSAYVEYKGAKVINLNLINTASGTSVSGTADITVDASNLNLTVAVHLSRGADQNQKTQIDGTTCVITTLETID